MTADQIITEVRQKGITLTVVGGKIECKAPVGTITPDMVERIKQNKPAIIRLLSSGGGFAPGECEACPAGGFWDYAHYAGQGRWCFHYAYYLGKSGRPTRCDIARHECPLNEQL